MTALLAVVFPHLLPQFKAQSVLAASTSSAVRVYMTSECQQAGLLGSMEPLLLDLAITGRTDTISLLKSFRDQERSKMPVANDSLADFNLHCSRPWLGTRRWDSYIHSCECYLTNYHNSSLCIPHHALWTIAWHGLGVNFLKTVNLLFGC